MTMQLHLTKHCHAEDFFQGAALEVANEPHIL